MAYAEVLLGHSSSPVSADVSFEVTLPATAAVQISVRLVYHMPEFGDSYVAASPCQGTVESRGVGGQQHVLITSSLPVSGYRLNRRVHIVRLTDDAAPSVSKLPSKDDLSPDGGVGCEADDEVVLVDVSGCADPDVASLGNVGKNDSGEFAICCDLPHGVRGGRAQQASGSAQQASGSALLGARGTKQARGIAQ